MKRLLAAVLGASLVCGASVPALAADTADTSIQAAPNEAARVERVLTYGVIVSMDTDGGVPSQILIRCPAQDDTEVILNLDASTILLDSGAGKPGDWGSLQAGTPIYVFHSPAMSRSLPPQTYAEAIVYNMPADAGCAMLHTVESVESTEKGVRFLTDGGSLYISVDENAAVSNLYTGETASLDGLQAGGRVFAWYDIVLESYPGQAYTAKLVLVPDEIPAGQETGEYSICLEHDMVLPEKAVWENGVLMVPLRAVAETLGCTVTWDEAAQAATMTNDTRTMTVTIGEDVYVSEAAPETGLIGMTAPVALGCAPFVDAEYRTWIPAKAFEVMVGFTVEIDEESGSVNIYPA